MAYTTIGTPSSVAADDLQVTVIFDVGDSTTSVTFDCSTKREVHDCLELWATIIHNANESVPDDEWPYGDEDEEDNS
jgi:hypothetical protein